MSIGPVPEALLRVVREEWRAVIATLVRDLRDLDLAEDAAQEAVVQALRTWPKTGAPDRPGAWLLTTARRKAIDRLRRDAQYAEKVQLLLASEERARVASSLRDPAEVHADRGDDEHRDHVGDDQLALIFACCHPALTTEAQVALTLRSLCGLTTNEIARAFFVPEATMAQRLVRAKRKLRDASVPFSVPEAADLTSRVDSVLIVVYLVFNEGYGASAGEHTIRGALCAEAIRLARLLARLLPDDAEVLGLLALLLLTEARRTARLDEFGDLVPLDEQDRDRWNAAMIQDGLAVLTRAAALQSPGPYQLQAAIAALHDLAPVADRTDWAAIATLYGELERRAPSPMISLNRSVAIAMADSPEAGLAHLERVDANDMAERHVYHVARAELLWRSGAFALALAAYDDALRLAPTGGERRFLTRRIAERRSSIDAGVERPDDQ